MAAHGGRVGAAKSVVRSRTAAGSRVRDEQKGHEGLPGTAPRGTPSIADERRRDARPLPSRATAKRLVWAHSMHVPCAASNKPLGAGLGGCQEGGSQMSSKIVRLCLLLGAVVLLIALAAGPALAAPAASTQEVTLGRLIAGDRSLSDPDGQSCADCHTPCRGVRRPRSATCLSPRASIQRTSAAATRPPGAYTAWSPILRLRRRRLGRRHVLGRPRHGLGPGLSPLAMQAMGPFLNPIEMSNESEADVIDEVRKASYRHALPEGVRAG